MYEDKLDSLLKPLVKKAIILKPIANKSALKASCDSKLGGAPYAEIGDSWPICPTCTKELTFVAQIHDDTEQHLFVFYYCHECFPWGLEDEKKGEWIVKLYKRPSNKKLIEINQKIKDELSPIPCTFVSSKIKVLPHWEEIGTVSKEASNICSQINDDSPWDVYEAAIRRAECFNGYATILGGYPYFVQGKASPTCPECNSKMEFYAQIDSEDEANIMWGDAGLVYFFRCPLHKNEFQLELQCY